MPRAIASRIRPSTFSFTGATRKPWEPAGFASRFRSAFGFIQ
jgi:hypothetical protein